MVTAPTQTPAPAPPTSRMRLKRRLRRGVAAAGAMTGLAALWHALAARRGVRVLCYHAIETPPSSAFAVAVEDFEAHIRYVAENCHPLSLDAYAAALREGRSLPPDSALVTFDDGYRDFLQNAVPILERYRVPATCFVIASKVDDGDPRFLTSEEIRRLTQSPFVTIGSHSRTHRSIAELPADEQRAEILGSREDFQALGLTVDHFCYPFGTFNDFDDDTTRLLAGSPYRLAFTSVNGVNFRRANPHRLHRTKIEWSDDPRTFARIMKGALDVWFLVDFFLRFLQKKRAYKFRVQRA